ncbi:hypothetical protein ACFVFH_32175 [Streptomyces sp. NPDC057697]|uniref:hypothetical protein n=1 Tax=Streptomyces sp. NPDC057697 TaxID=3346219 RepID=UPI0036AE803B
MSVPGLDVVPDSVCLQQGGELPLDDVVVLNRKGPYELAVERQVKRTLEIARSSDPWRKTIRQCVQSLESFGGEMDADRHRLGVTASGPSHGLEVLQSLAAYAAAQKGVDDLLRILPGLGQEHRRVWKHLADTVRDVPAESEAAPEQELVELSAF